MPGVCILTAGAEGPAVSGGIVGVQLTSALAIVLSHAVEIIKFRRTVGGFNMKRLVNYFNDLILCIAPAAIVMITFELAIMFITASDISNNTITECLFYHASKLAPEAAKEGVEMSLNFGASSTPSDFRRGIPLKGRQRFRDRKRGF
ncbi:hypothetical protein HDV00_006021 [Rhizophlyctis rosea]|nr:hypothetical protein HDV00_006021 [Rhizophlyctis rosea]